MSRQSFSKVRSAAIDGRARNPFFKKTQLWNLHGGLVASAADIQKAIQKDTGHNLAEVRVEFWLALRCLTQIYDSIDPDTELQEEYSIAKGEDAPNAREPVGIVVIEPTMHTFLYSLISALAPAIGAGNCVVVQMERSMLETPELVLSLTQKALDDDIFEIARTTVSPSELGHRHRKIFQKGSAESPLIHHVVSEVQNRVVAIVERDADLDAAAKSLVAARFGLKGTSPYAPDVILVNEWVKKDFLAAVSRHSVALLSSVSADLRTTRNASSPAVVKELLKNGGGGVLSTSSSGAIVEVENRQSELLRRKVSEPCILVHSVTSMDDAIDVAVSLGRLSAAYIFTSPAAAKYICQFIDASICLVNHLPLKLLYGPVAPSDHSFSPDSLTSYNKSHFTVPKTQFIRPTKANQRLDKLILEPSSLSLRNLNDEAKADLTGMVRPQKGGDIGFFNQGIVTGGILVLSTALSCTGLLCYYLVRFARASL